MIEANQTFVIGIIIGAHGVGGSVKVLPTTDDPMRFKMLKTCLLATETTSQEIAISYKFHAPQAIVLAVEGVTTREQAIALKSAKLLVRREDSIKLDEGRWFVCDLVGCNVSDELHGDLGTIKEIIERPGQDIWVVEAPSKSDILIPYTTAFVTNVDITNKQVKTSLPDGLVDLYRE